MPGAKDNVESSCTSVSIQYVCQLVYLVLLCLCDNGIYSGDFLKNVIPFVKIFKWLISTEFLQKIVMGQVNELHYKCKYSQFLVATGHVSSIMH